MIREDLNLAITELLTGKTQQERTAKFSKNAPKPSKDREMLLKAYLYVFDEFATSTDEVALHLGVMNEVALNVLNDLEGHNLVGGEFTNGQGSWTGDRKAYPGTFKVWQCNRTYDELTREEAIKVFDEAYPLGELRQSLNTLMKS
jgi:hypothetical protein